MFLWISIFQQDLLLTQKLMYLHLELIFNNNLDSNIFLIFEKPCDFCVQRMHSVELSKWMLGVEFFRFSLKISGAQVPKHELQPI